MSNKIYDPVHGFIHFDEDEKQLINSYVFQRLRNIRQLGGASFVFPGAVHSRLEHSLGVMELSSRIYKKICSNTRPDLISFIPRKNSPEYFYYKKILRIAALSHDLGHLPFSHIAEKDLLGDFGHEKITLLILKSDLLKELFNRIKAKFLFLKDKNIVEDIIKISLGEKILTIIDKEKTYQFTNFEKVLSQIIIGDFFGTDRIDYLLRDAKFTGLSYGAFDYTQLMEALRILPKNKKEISLGIEEDGIESCEALIFARHFMYKRVYKNPKVLSFNFHLRRFIKNIFKDIDLTILENFLKTSDASLMQQILIKSKDKNDLLYDDAKAIIYRKNKFQAKKIPKSIKEKDLIKFKEKNNIKDSDMFWEFLKEQNIDLSFLVSKDLQIYPAKEVSQLLSSDFSTEDNWVFLSPKYELLFNQIIK